MKNLFRFAARCSGILAVFLGISTLAAPVPATRSTPMTTNFSTGVPLNTEVPTWDSVNNRWDFQVPPGAGGGEANTESNLGATGYGVAYTKFGVDLRFNSIDSGLGLTTTSNANVITITPTVQYQQTNTVLTTWAGITPAANIGTFLATPSSANFAAAVTGETGTGALVFGTAPELSTIELGNATDTTIARISGGVLSVEGNLIYMAAGADIALGDGGTAASLADPGANRLWGWDDTDNAIGFWTLGAGMSFDHASHTLSSTVTGGGSMSNLNTLTYGYPLVGGGDGGAIATNSFYLDTVYAGAVVVTNNIQSSNTWSGGIIGSNYVSTPSATIGTVTITNNISVVFSPAITTVVNMTNGFRTNTVAGAISITQATNGISGQLLKSTVAFYNGSGSDQTLTIPNGAGVGWQTNTYSPVPTKLTNLYVTMMYLTSLDATDTAAKQTNVLVSFEYYKNP